MNVPDCLTNISPRWAKILKTYSIGEIINGTFTPDNVAIPNDDNNSLYELEQKGTQIARIGDFSCCIVGEAHLFDTENDSMVGNRYKDCGTCYSFSMAFCTELEALDDGSDSSEALESMLCEYEDRLELFCEHIGDEHPELIKNQGECE